MIGLSPSSTSCESTHMFVFDLLRIYIQIDEIKLREDKKKKKIRQNINSRREQTARDRHSQETI